MKDSNRMFFDGMNTVRMIEGVIRMDFYNVVNQGKDLQQVPAGEIMMSQAAFLRAYSAMENLVSQLEKAGIIKRKEGEEAENNGQKSAGEASSADTPSPNFQ